MKALLLYRDRSIDLSAPRPPAERALVQDLGLVLLFDVMGQGDKHVRDIAEKVLPLSLGEVEAVRYRQEILRDCLEMEGAIREMYSLCVETLELERKNHLWSSSKYPTSMLHRSVDVLEMVSGRLRHLRDIAEESRERFRSSGLTRFAAMLISELSDEYLEKVRGHLKLLKFRHGVTMSAKLGTGNKGVGYVLRRPVNNSGWLGHLLNTGPTTYTYRIPDRDENGARALSELQERGINLVANALTQSTDHILHFLRTLRDELAFYVGCLNLHHELMALGVTATIPEVTAPADLRLNASGLIDVGLLLSLRRNVVGNDIHADGKALVVITGANQGGKSTFLRSVGLAQLMMQSGMFVAADRFSASLVARVLTHFKREEDASMSSGKFDEELVRMNQVVDVLVPYSLVLFNESFSTTNEREGSEVARQIVETLRAHAIRIFFVTHQFELANGLHAQGRTDSLFLRAERAETGVRTFKLQEAEPLRTSFGTDLYRRIFGSEAPEAVQANVRHMADQQVNG